MRLQRVDRRQRLNNLCGVVVVPGNAGVERPFQHLAFVLPAPVVLFGFSRLQRSVLLSKNANRVAVTFSVAPSVGMHRVDRRFHFSSSRITVPSSGPSQAALAWPLKAAIKVRTTRAAWIIMSYLLAKNKLASIIWVSYISHILNCCPLLDR